MKCSRFAIVAAALVCSMALLPGCNKSNKTEAKSTAAAPAGNTAAMGAMNDKCPLSGMAVNKSAPTATYNGKTVGFCCGGCQGKFNAMTDAQKKETMAKLAAK